MIQYPKRILSKTFEFVVLGRPLGYGNPSGKRDEKKHTGGKDAYIAHIRMAAKAAMTEQGWEIVPADEPVYLVITISVGVIHNPMGGKPRDVLEKGERLAVRSPNINRITELIMKTLNKLAYERLAQVVAVTVLKRYGSKQEGVAVLCGRPRNWSELNHDLRNA